MCRPWVSGKLSNLSLNQISFVRLSFVLVYSNEAMGGEVHYSTKVVGIVSEAWKKNNLSLSYFRIVSLLELALQNRKKMGQCCWNLVHLNVLYYFSGNYSERKIVTNPCCRQCFSLLGHPLWGILTYFWNSYIKYGKFRGKIIFHLFLTK